jgi:hypothetical protein
MILSRLKRGVREFYSLLSRIEKIFLQGMVRCGLPITPSHLGESKKSNSPIHRSHERNKGLIMR